MDEELSCDSMADMTGEAEYNEGGQLFIVVKRSSWKVALVVKATRATYINQIRIVLQIDRFGKSKEKISTSTS
jgi:hypothetical protein